MVIALLIFLFSLNSFGANISLEKLLSEQARDYQEKKFDKVFARGHFYRYQYLRNNDEIKAAFSPNLYKLEVFALAQKCQWQMVQKLVSEFERLEKIKYNSASKTKEINQKIASFKAYKLVTKEKSKEIDDALENSVVVAAIDWSTIKSIQGISVEVEDLCQK